MNRLKRLTFGCNDLVVVLAQVHSLTSPCIEMSLHIYRATGALVLPHRPILLKGPRTIDRRLVSTRRLRNLVGGAIASHSALVLAVGRRVVCPKVLDNVVLDERVASPAVDGKVRVAVILIITRVGDGATCSGVPAFASDHVAACLPGYAVAATRAVGVDGFGATVGPPRVKAACGQLEDALMASDGDDLPLCVPSEEGVLCWRTTRSVAGAAKAVPASATAAVIIEMK